MGLFSMSPRRSSKHEASSETKIARRMSIRNVLSRRESATDAKRAPAAPLRKSNSLTVLVNPPAEKAPTGPCRFVATSTKLGSGAYGAVLLGRDLCTSAPVAIKFIPDGRMRTSSLDREVSMLQKLSDANHPALVKFYGHVRPADVKAGEIRAEGTLPLNKPHTACHALVMEAARGGELFDHVVRCEGLRESESAPLFAQLCDAVRTSHGLGIAHRDLKLENVLLVHKKNQSRAASSPRMVQPGSSIAREAAQSAIKLIDWGLAHQHTITSEGMILPEMLHSRCGSRSYMAPEVTNRDISGTIGYDGFAADMWSLGVCLFAMHLAFFPFEQANPELDWRARRVTDAQRAGKSTMATILSFYPQKAANGGLSAPLLALLDRLLVFEPHKRATLAEVLCSEWLAPHVPAACYAAALAQPLRLATRTSRSTSMGSEGPLTPRFADDTKLSRQDSSGTTTSRCSATSAALSVTSSIASSGHHHLPFPQLNVGLAGGGWPAAADLSPPDTPIHDPMSGLPPPPPTSPRPTARKAPPREEPPQQVVVAGGSHHGHHGGREGPRASPRIAASPRPPASTHKYRDATPPNKHGRCSSSTDREAVQLAQYLANTCKVSKQHENGSPRKPDRPFGVS